MWSTHVGDSSLLLSPYFEYISINLKIIFLSHCPRISCHGNCSAIMIALVVERACSWVKILSLWCGRLQWTEADGPVRRAGVLICCYPEWRQRGFRGTLCWCRPCTAEDGFVDRCGRDLVHIYCISKTTNEIQTFCEFQKYNVQFTHLMFTCTCKTLSRTVSLLTWQPRITGLLVVSTVPKICLWKRSTQINGSLQVILKVTRGLNIITYNLPETIPIHLISACYTATLMSSVADVLIPTL